MKITESEINEWCKKILKSCDTYDDEWEIKKIKPTIREFYLKFCSD